MAYQEIHPPRFPHDLWTDLFASEIERKALPRVRSTPNTTQAQVVLKAKPVGGGFPESYEYPMYQPNAWGTFHKGITLIGTGQWELSLELKAAPYNNVVNGGVVDFDDVRVSIQGAPPANVQANLWTDPGAEGSLAALPGVEVTGDVRVEDQLGSAGTQREGLHGIRIAPGGMLKRTFHALEESVYDRCSAWFHNGSVWQLRVQNNLVPSAGSLTVTLSEAGLYDQLCLTKATGSEPERWIP